MPRRPKPCIPLVIEGLSTGREVRPREIIDDFTGEAIPVVQDTRPMRELPDGQALRDAHNRHKLAAKRAFLESVGILPSKPRLVAPSIAGMRAIRVNDQFAIYVERKPWRRV